MVYRYRMVLSIVVPSLPLFTSINQSRFKFFVKFYIKTESDLKVRDIIVKSSKVFTHTSIMARRRTLTGRKERQRRREIYLRTHNKLNNPKMPRKGRGVTGDSVRKWRRQKQRERRMRIREERLRNIATHVQASGTQENEEEREGRLMIPWNVPLLTPICGIQSTLLPCKTVNQMKVRMNNAEAKGPPDEPMKKELNGCKPIQGNHAILLKPCVEIPAGTKLYPLLLLQSVNETESNLNSNINLVNGYSNFTNCNIGNGNVINITPAFHINATASKRKDKLNIVMPDKSPQVVCDTTLVMNSEACKTVELASDSSAKVCGITIKSEVIDDSEESTNDCIVNSGIKRTFDSVPGSVIKSDDQKNFTKIKIKKENDDGITSTSESVSNVRASQSDAYIKQEFIDDSDKSTDVTYQMNDEITKTSKCVSDFSTNEYSVPIQSEAIDSVIHLLSFQSANTSSVQMYSSQRRKPPRFILPKPTSNSDASTNMKVTENKNLNLDETNKNCSAVNIIPAIDINTNAGQFHNKLNFVILDRYPQEVCNTTTPAMNSEVIKTVEFPADSNAEVCGVTIKSEVMEDNEESMNHCLINNGIKRTLDSMSDSVIKSDEGAADHKSFRKNKIKNKNDGITSTSESVCNVSASQSNVYIKQEFIDDNDKSTGVTYLMNDESTKISKYVSNFSTSECNVSIKSEAIDVSAALSTQDASNTTCTMNSVIKKSTKNFLKSNALQVALYKIEKKPTKKRKTVYNKIVAF